MDDQQRDQRERDLATVRDLLTRYEDREPGIEHAFVDALATARKEGSRDLTEAVATVRKYVGCGDNSCLFEKPSGPGTNGGCQCITHARPFVAAALARLYKLASSPPLEALAAGDAPRSASEERADVVAWLSTARFAGSDGGPITNAYGETLADSVANGDHVGAAARKNKE